MNTFRTLYYNSKPVILKDYFADLPALKLWPANAFNHLRKFDDTFVPVELTRGSQSYASTTDSNFERAELPLSVFLDFLNQAEQSLKQGISLSDVKVYLAQHALFDSIPDLYHDVCRSDYVSMRDGRLAPVFCGVDRKDLYNVNAWIGLSTHTPLHYDPNHNIYAQIYGKKEVIIFPPTAKKDLDMHTDPLLKNTSRIASVFNDSHGGLASDTIAAGLRGSLEAGDALYIPQGWVHTFQGDSGISASVNWWFK